MAAMEEQKVFDSIPKAEDICFEGKENKDLDRIRYYDAGAADTPTGDFFLITDWKLFIRPLIVYQFQMHSVIPSCRQI